MKNLLDEEKVQHKIKTYKFRCYLDQDQQNHFKELIRNNVFVYNYVISICNDFYFQTKRQKKKELLEHLNSIDNTIVENLITSSNEFRKKKGYELLPIESNSFLRIKETVIFGFLKQNLPTKQYKECSKLNAVYFDSILKRLNDVYPLGDDKTGRQRNKWGSLTSFITILRGDFPFLKLNSSQQLGMTTKQIEDTYKKFFKGNGGLPKLKIIKEKQSITFNGSDVSTTHHKILYDNILPKFGSTIKRITHRPIEGHIQTVTLSKVEGYSNDFYVCIQTRKVIQKSENILNLDNAIGIDPGLKTLISFSNGDRFEIPENILDKIQRIETKMIRLNRAVSRKYEIRKNISKTPSNRESKNRQMINSLHKDKKELYKNFLHNISSRITKRYDFIFWEDTHIAELLTKQSKAKSNKNLRVKIIKQCWYELSLMLEYKMKHQQKIFQRVEAKNTTQTCNVCDNIKKDGSKLTLNVRMYKCDVCGLVMDRDLNAAKNILKNGIKMLENVGLPELSIV